MGPTGSVFRLFTAVQQGGKTNVLLFPSLFSFVNGFFSFSLIIKVLYEIGSVQHQTPLLLPLTGISDAVAQVRFEFFQDKSRQVHVLSHLDGISVFPGKDKILRRPSVCMRREKREK